MLPLPAVSVVPWSVGVVSIAVAAGANVCQEWLSKEVVQAERAGQLWLKSFVIFAVTSLAGAVDSLGHLSGQPGWCSLKKL